MLNIVVFEPSDIAFRRTIPAILKSNRFKYFGIAVADANERNAVFKSSQPPSENRVLDFKNNFGGKIYNSFTEVLEDDCVSAVYLPLPPGLHYYWAKEIIKHKKHLFIEKPFVLNFKDAVELVELAKEYGVSIHVNYAFLFHKQIQNLKDYLINKDIFGDYRFANANFGFPYRGSGDFRYNLDLGGGALFDCGCYPLIFLDYLFSYNGIIDYANVSLSDKQCPLFGSFIVRDKMTNRIGVGSFGMDNSYKCDVDLWGSKNKIISKRVFSPTADLSTSLTIIDSSGNEQKIEIGADDQFLNSVNYFYSTITSEKLREENFKIILHHASLLESVKNYGKETK